MAITQAIICTIQQRCYTHSPWMNPFRKSRKESNLKDVSKTFPTSRILTLVCHVAHKIGAEIGKRKPGITQQTAVDPQTDRPNKSRIHNHISKKYLDHIDGLLSVVESSGNSTRTARTWERCTMR